MQIAGSEQQFKNPKDLIQQSHFPSIDGLRAVSIITVLLCHLMISGPFEKYFDGGIGVEVFFVISGFLITMLLLKEKAKYGTVSLKKFYIRRALRIVPVALLFVIVLIVLNWLFVLHISKTSFIMSALYLKNMPIKSGQQDWYTGHFWSLSVEEQFYIFFPAFLIFSVNKTKITTIILIVVIPIITYLGFTTIPLFSQHIIHTIIFLVVNLLGEGTTAILTGCLLAILLFNGFFKKLPQNKWLTLVLFIIALAFRTQISPIFIPYASLVIFDFLIGFIIILNLNQDNYFAWVLNRPFMIKLGILSYSIYIWQQLFMHNQPWAHSFRYSDSPFLNIPAMFLVAYLSYHFYEKKFLKLKDKFSKN